MKKVVFTYHIVGEDIVDYNNTCVSPQNFKKQIEYINSNFEILPMDEFIHYSGEEYVAAITFDDGYKSIFDTVIPIIENIGVPITIFITCSEHTEYEFWMSDIARMIYAGRFQNSRFIFCLYGSDINIPLKDINDRCSAYYFVRKIMMECSKETRDRVLTNLHEQSQVEWKGRKTFLPLDENDILELSNNRLVTIGAHTVSHTSLAKFSEEEQRMEIEESINKLQQILKRKIKYFAYPFGNDENINTTTIKILKDNKIEAAFTTRNSIVSEQDDLLLIPRVNCVNDNNFSLDKATGQVIASEFIDDKYVFCGKKTSDYSIRDKKKIVICGCGKKLAETLEYLKLLKIEKEAVSVVDNDKTKIDSCISGYKIHSYDEFYNNKEVTWVINNKYGYDIFVQLVNQGVKNIHWWI